MFSIVVDPQKMGTADNLAGEVEAFVAWYQASPPAAGVGQVQVAGDPERATRQRRLVEGIAVDAVTWREIIAAGEKVGVGAANLDQLIG